MHTGDQVRIEQVRSIYRNSAPGTVTTLITVVVLAAGLVYIDAAVRSKALVVGAAMCLQTCARRFLSKQPHNWLILPT